MLGRLGAFQERCQDEDDAARSRAVLGPLVRRLGGAFSWRGAYASLRGAYADLTRSLRTR